MPQPTRQPSLAAIDERIYRRFRSPLHQRQRAERLLVGVNKAQNWWALASLSALVIDRNRRGAWARANAALAAAWAAAKLISRAIRRPRPNFADCRPARHHTDRQSFPSTHATTAFAATVAVPPLLPRRPLILHAVTTASARLLLGEHYPSDILGGAALGAVVAAPFARAGT